RFWCILTALWTASFAADIFDGEPVHQLAMRGLTVAACLMSGLMCRECFKELEERSKDGNGQEQ
ncbi:MAG: hypothetical protein NC489_45195, partial [Ruminococcus flavefaciens]|nr:hypothetical protein [Ruminococcus flavefaciens]